MEFKDSAFKWNISREEIIEVLEIEDSLEFELPDQHSLMIIGFTRAN